MCLNLQSLKYFLAASCAVEVHLKMKALAARCPLLAGSAPDVTIATLEASARAKRPYHFFVLEYL